MSDRPQETSTAGEETWTDSIHHVISSTSGAIHRAVDAVVEFAEGNSENPEHDQPTSTTKQTSKPSDPEPGQSASPTLTDKPSHTDTYKSDPSESSGKTKEGGLPPPQSKGPESATSRGDAPQKGDDSASNQRQVNKGSGVGSTDDPKSRLKGTQDSGPVSMSGADTSHPGAGATPAAAGGAPVGDPASGQKPPEDKKSKEDEEDEGTGQKVVKASGVAAKGGDFDAAKPGAGVRSLHLTLGD
jgi:hypothetical protein